ncbi:hypothetical protein ANN_08952 [Periplaneta americana]|uniref:Uncharacterized protein n=1 Tax=Periplaneta americana TaxID=6978 RepID=A0ABQ8T2N9_PERAM|nr:hypothetical protein ANN_08952 [Periplaneta americana]
MVGLCEGGNEPPGSLKASNYQGSLRAIVGFNVSVIRAERVVAAFCAGEHSLFSVNVRGMVLHRSAREALRNATEPVHSGFDLNEAAKKFGVLKATLASRNKYPVEGKVFFGPRPVLGEAICNNIREMTHTCF